MIASHPAPTRTRLVSLRRGLIVAAYSIALATFGAFFAGVYVVVYLARATHELTVILIIAGLAVGVVLLLARFVAVQLAKRISEPLEQLVAESARMGRLELDQPVDVRSSWLEVDALTQAQEAMRVRLVEEMRRGERVHDENLPLSAERSEGERGLGGEVRLGVECERTLAPTGLGGEVREAKEQIHEMAPLDIPGLDVAGSIRRLGGLEHVYFSALRLFIRGHARAAHDIRAALDAGEHGQAVRLCHTLKGVSGTVGAADVERAATALGLALAENAPRSDVDPLLNTLGAHLDDAVARVRSRVADT